MSTSMSAERVSFNRAALIIIEAQRQFCDPAFKKGSGTDATDAACRHASTLMQDVRRAGRNPYFIQTLSGSREGSKPHAIELRAGDIVITKKARSAFENTALDTHLRARNVDHLVIAGVNASFAVFATAHNAMEAGYRVTLVDEAIADGQVGTPISRDFSLWELGRQGARVVSMQDARLILAP